jgi:signal peptidase I
VEEPYVRFTDEGPTVGRRDNFGPVVVPDGHFFALGDNRDRSYDSRFWGSVPADHLRGRAPIIYWSRNEGMPRWERIGAAIR